MLKSFTVRVVVGVLCAAFLSIAITVFFGIRTIEQGQELDVRDRMLSEAALASEIYSLNRNDAQSVYEAVSRDKGAEYSADVRLTIIDAQGRVLFDSAPDKSPGDFDNHADRPEISQAMETGKGFSLRDSSSLKTRFVYTAVRMEDGGILRLAVPMASVQHNMWNRTEVLLQVGALAVVISLVMAMLVSLSLKNSFLPMIGIVEAIAAGKLHRRIRHYPGREFAPLAEAVNTMAQSIEEQVHSYADQTAQLETVLNTMSDGVLVLGPRGHIRRCNRTMERCFPGIGNARGRQVVEIIPYPALQNAVNGMLHEVPAKAGSTLTQTVSLHMGLQSGQVFSIFLSRPQKPDPRCGLVAVFHDVTDVMRLEQVRRDFVANVSHELRTPLTAISGYAETILSVRDMEQCRRFAQVILRNANGLERMIRDLLSLTRLEREGTVISLSPISVRDAVEDALSVCHNAFTARNVQVESSIPEGCRVMADETYLSQIFRNLLENASRYAEEGSTVHISSVEKEDQLFFRVSNRGPLIPRQDLERIFERFYSVERHRGQGTTGLGLAICRHILERFHGRIWAESPDSEGCTSFVFTLQKAEDSVCGSDEQDDKSA